jgi:hypothetical protein
VVGGGTPGRCLVGPSPRGFSFSAGLDVCADKNTRLTQLTLTAWQPRSRRPLTAEDAREINSNLSGFCRILREWMAVELNQRPGGDGDAARGGLQ